MQLVMLTSSNPKFRSIKFLPGLNIILGKKVSNNQQDTYNSVGKSLSHELVHFMLCGTLPEKLTNILADYDMHMSFIHSNTQYNIYRSMSTPSDIQIDGCQTDVKQARDMLFKIFVSNYSNGRYDNNLITFRNLFSRFARAVSDEAYSNAIHQITVKENPYINNMLNSLILGLDTYLIDEKQATMKLKEEIKQTKTHISKMQHQFDNPSQIYDLDDQIDNIDKGLKSFHIENSLSQLREQADDLSVKISDLRNEICSNERKIKNKAKSLKIEPNIHFETIEKLYNEASYFFNEKVKTTLLDAYDFHIRLLESRKKRLLMDINNLNKMNIELSSTIESLESELSGLMCFLHSAGAFEDRDCLRDELEKLRIKRDNLKLYDNLMSDLKLKTSRLNQELERIKAAAILYLNSNSSLIEKLQKSFRDITRCFYNEHPGMLSINVPDSFSRNKKVFEIDPHIEGDVGGGINRVKIFCYDLLVSKLNTGLFDFMMHDSRLFSEMDERQRALCFEIIAEECASSGLQYVCSINHDMFQSILNNTKDSALRNMLRDSVVLELTDECPEKKLFGFQFSYRRKK